VRLWDGFVEAAGGDAGDAPTIETEECVRAWTAPGDIGEKLVRLYAIESGQPPISRTKREGLLERYGFADGAGTAYFRVHETRDVEHAAEARELISELAGDADPDAIVAEAESAFRANWRLLDGV
jgi:pyrroloquinoline quinone (PQQ) biosynthesis protein C